MVSLCLKPYLSGQTLFEYFSTLFLSQLSHYLIVFFYLYLFSSSRSSTSNLVIPDTCLYKISMVVLIIPKATIFVACSGFCDKFIIASAVSSETSFVFFFYLKLEIMMESQHPSSWKETINHPQAHLIPEQYPQLPSSSADLDK